MIAHGTHGLVVFSKLKRRLMTSLVFTQILSGSTLGLFAGPAPGPMLALVVDRGKSLVQNRGYPWIMRGLGIVLWIFGALLLIKGLLILLS